MTSIESARALRARMTPAERLLWRQIRGRRLGGLKFRRQEPFGPFVVDFLCEEIRMVIEVDGGIHDQHEQAEQDAYRTAFIESHGYQVVRFRNEAILMDINDVLRQIMAAAQARLRPQPS